MCSAWFNVGYELAPVLGGVGAWGVTHSARFEKLQLDGAGQKVPLPNAPETLGKLLHKFHKLIRAFLHRTRTANSSRPGLPSSCSAPTTRPR